MHRTIVRRGCVWGGWVASLLLTLPLGAAELSFSDSRWTIEAKTHRVETFEGRETLYLENGSALLEDVPFLDGVIEFEVMLGTQRGFSGARWRAVDRKNYEEFYVRPHQSGNADANQYQPVFNGVAGWQIYYGAEYSVAATYAPGTWIPIRIEVLGDRAQVFIDSEEPSLVIDDLEREAAAGAIGLMSGWEAARFSRFRYRLTDELTIAPRGDVEGDGPERRTAGLIRKWTVSDAVPEAALEGKSRLPDSIRRERRWSELEVESNGVANLARLQGVSEGANTALVKLVLEADEATTQRVDFGFSDRVRAYLNGQLLYSGNDRWQSRDYRFLGTVGTYDALHLPLRRGSNELIFAVSESFGGWAITGNVVPEGGVRLP